MARALSPLLLITALALPLVAADSAASTADTAAFDAAQLAAARAASLPYQHHLDAIRTRLESTDEAAHIDAIRSIENLDDPNALAIVLTFLERSKPTVNEQIAAAVAFGGSNNPAAIPTLRAYTNAADPELRLAAYNALGQLAAANAVNHTARAKDVDASHHLAGLTNLGTAKVAEAAALLADGLANDSQAIIRRQCVLGLAKLGDPAHGPTLQAALSDPDANVRQYAAEGIATLNYRPAIPYIIFALEANLAGDALNRVIINMTGQDFGFRSTDISLARKAAVDRGFAWWSAHGAEGK